MSEVAKLTHVMAIGANSWGKGLDAVEAIQNWKKNSGMVHRPTTLHMRAVSKDAHVDGMGTLYSDGMEKLPDVTITVEQADLIWNGIEVLNELCYPVDDAVYALEDNGKFKSSEG
jgi:hypothetical protein